MLTERSNHPSDILYKHCSAFGSQYISLHVREITIYELDKTREREGEERGRGERRGKEGEGRRGEGEKEALNKLSKRTDIVIKRVDKGACIVVAL